MLLPCQVKDVGKSDELAVGGGAGLIFREIRILVCGYRILFQHLICLIQANDIILTSDLV